MNDKDFAKFGFIIVALVFLWWVWMRKQSNAAAATQASAPTTTTSDPEQTVFENQPAGYPIQSAGNLGSITIANQGLSTLSNQYMPLFGFVGVAQGVGYQ